MSESPDRHPARETTAAGLDGDGAASEAGEHRDQARDLDDAVLQVTEQLADVAVAARECVEMLGALALELRELVNERARHGDASAVDGGAPPGSPAPDILEAAAREAEAAGVSLADYVREAVLAYDPPRAEIEPRARGHEARREAARTKEETQAVRAQSRQAIAHADQLLDTARSLGAPTSHPDGATA